MYALKNNKLVLNENVRMVMNVSGCDPTFETVQDILRQSKDYGSERNELIGHLREFFSEHVPYKLIRVQDLLKAKDWNSVQTVPLDFKHFDRSKVLMISHRWPDEDRPDPDQKKLRMIQNYLHKKCQNLEYEHVFVDFKCIQHYIANDKDGLLLEMNNLYKVCNCLCIVDELYFHRAWCLFELCVNLFYHESAKSPILVHESHYRVKQEPVWERLQKMMRTRGVGYRTTLEDHFEIGGKVYPLPCNADELNHQLKELIRYSKVTKPKDIARILYLFDVLIQKKRP